MKLAEWARSSGVHPQTAYRWFREGKMPVAARRLESGMIWVEAPAAEEAGRTVVYARVSSHDQRSGLDRQVCRLTQWATSNGCEIGEVVCAVGSGLNGKRRRLRRVLSGPSATVVVVKHRDRLARFGVENLKAALSAQGRRIVVADPGETTDDLARDMIEVLTLMRARLGGRRGARNRAMRAITAAKTESGQVP
ncbi:IS607 family transposase [Mycobacterium sp. SM1]|uniref:IS607 family transposase n=1 Tax=Mycobacterium sp. SM1 TaxID=2816243 RepID=UPI001BCB9C04|nr:IS607 family transposase [Mycobacterium sp. SM1]MBS4728243.1 IS607 family transposase [Mycobacterium sp. SM1]